MSCAHIVLFARVRLSMRQVTPKLRADVQCFGRDDCFPAAFGVPGLLMFIATVIFLSGRRLYVMKKPDRNVTGDFARAVWVSISSKVTDKHSLRSHRFLFSRSLRLPPFSCVAGFAPWGVNLDEVSYEDLLSLWSYFVFSSLTSIH